MEEIIEERETNRTILSARRLNNVKTETGVKFYLQERMYKQGKEDQIMQQLINQHQKEVQNTKTDNRQTVEDSTTPQRVRISSVDEDC